MNGIAKIPNLQELQTFDVNRRGEYEGIRQTFYDANVYAAAGQTQLQFFQVPLGQGVSSAPGASGAKTFNDTNMQSAGQLPQPQHFLVESIELYLFPGGAPTTNLTTIAPTTFTNDMFAVAESGDLDFFIGSKSYLREAPLNRFPPKTKMNVDAFHTAQLLQGAPADAEVQLSTDYAAWVGRPYFLAPPVLLVPNQNFNVSLNWAAAVPVSADARMFCVLDGILYRQSQ